MDCVTSLGGVPVLLDEWGHRRGLFGQPEVPVVHPGPVAGEFFGSRCGSHPRRTTPPPGFGSRIWAWCWATGAAPSAPTTTPRRSIRCTACNESLVILAEEGLEAAWQRHRDNHLAWRRVCRSWGWISWCGKTRVCRSSTRCGCRRVDEAAGRARLLNEFGLEIGAGLGALAGKVWAHRPDGPLEPRIQHRPIAWRRWRR